MRRRYIVMHRGRGIGWVHAANPMEAIKKVAVMKGKPAEECVALLFEVRNQPRGDGGGGGCGLKAA